MTPLATVATHLRGTVINVSGRGLQVRVAALKELPRTGDVYRIQSGNDLILCEVRYGHLTGAGAELGFQIVHWAKAGELSRVLKEFKR